jgi:hypothetical protein
MSASPEVRAKQAIADEAKHEANAAAARCRRDAAIHDMRGEDPSLRPPEIARRLGLSTSLVRLALSKPRPSTTVAATSSRAAS